MAYELSSYEAVGKMELADEDSAVALVFERWPNASVSFLVDEIDRVEHAVIWKDKASQAAYDQPVGWVKPNGVGFDRSKWRQS